MKRFRAAIGLLLSLQVFSLSAQISVSEPPSVTNLMQDAWSSPDRTLSAYSIQLSVTTDRFRADEIKMGFLRRYPEMSYFTLFENPNYRFLVGAFLNKADANATLKRLAGDYPDAYIVINEKVKAKDLLGN